MQKGQYNIFSVSLYLALTASAAEKFLVENSWVRATENRFLNQGRSIIGFSLCMARKAVGVIVSNYALHKLAAIADSKRQGNSVQSCSAMCALGIGLYRHLSSYKNDGNSSGLRAGYQEYWQKWNDKILREKIAQNNRNRQEIS